MQYIFLVISKLQILLTTIQKSALAERSFYVCKPAYFPILFIMYISKIICLLFKDKCLGKILNF